MVSKKKKQKKQTNNAIPENWIIKKNIKENKVHKYYSNRDNIGDLTNRRIFIDNYLKEQEQQQKSQLIRSPQDRKILKRFVNIHLNEQEQENKNQLIRSPKDINMLKQFEKMIEHSNKNLSYHTKFQDAGRYYTNSLKQEAFNVLLRNAQYNKQNLEEKTPDLINHSKIMTEPQPQQKEDKSPPWSFRNMISNFIGTTE